jgi:hypothetical protein
MNKLLKLMSLCKCGVYIEVNQHRDFYQSVEKYCNDLFAVNESLRNEIPKEVMVKMIETDTVISVQAYPDTPIGFYSVLHYDLEKALDEVIKKIEG